MKMQQYGCENKTICAWQANVRKRRFYFLGEERGRHQTENHAVFVLLFLPTKQPFFKRQRRHELTSAHRVHGDDIIQWGNREPPLGRREKIARNDEIGGRSSVSTDNRKNASAERSD